GRRHGAPRARPEPRDRSLERAPVRASVEGAQARADLEENRAREAQGGMVTSVRLHNTLGRRLSELTPLEPGHVRLYTCGPTDHIPEMVAMIETLGERGHTYESDGSVYFRIATFPDYGKLSGIDLTQMRRGERVAEDEYEKEDVKDFALWKGAKPGEPSWPSP